MAENIPKYSLDDSLGYLVYQTSGSIRKQIGRDLIQKGYPIKPEQFTALVYIWDKEGLSQGELAEKMYRDKTTVTRLLAKIEEIGLIERISGPTDAREKRIFLTKKGKKVMTRITQLVQQILMRAQNGIDPREMEICKDVLRRVRRNMALP